MGQVLAVDLQADGSWEVLIVNSNLPTYIYPHGHDVVYQNWEEFGKALSQHTNQTVHFINVDHVLHEWSKNQDLSK